MSKWSVRKHKGAWWACDETGLAQYESPHWTSALMYAVMGSEGHKKRTESEMTIRRVIEAMRIFRKDSE